VTEKLVRPRPVVPQLFSERVEGVDGPAAEALCKALKAAGLLNTTDFLKEDPRCFAPQTRAQTCHGSSCDAGQYILLVEGPPRKPKHLPHYLREHESNQAVQFLLVSVGYGFLLWIQ